MTENTHVPRRPRCPGQTEQCGDGGGRGDPNEGCIQILNQHQMNMDVQKHIQSISDKDSIDEIKNVVNKCCQFMADADLFI